MTRQAFLNAITIVNILGGSTNAVSGSSCQALCRNTYHSIKVLHILAMARSADVDITVDDFQRIADKTPYLADLKPSGKYYFEDVHRVGGIPALMKYLINHTDLIDGSQMTVTGKTIAENLQHVQELDFTTQDVIYPVEKPIKTTGHLTILRGSLAPGSAVAKITGKEGTRFEVSGR
jgi:dihydroxy-acid dehydratase